MYQPAAGIVNRHSCAHVKMCEKLKNKALTATLSLTTITHTAPSMHHLGSALRRASMARPLGTASATGFVVMSAGDAASQLATSSESAVDVRRNLVSAGYNSLASPAFYMWYRFMDWAVPTTSPARLAQKVSQLPQPLRGHSPAMIAPPSDHHIPARSARRCCAHSSSRPASTTLCTWRGATTSKHGSSLGMARSHPIGVPSGRRL